MIDVQCPSCSKAYRLSDDKAGKKFRCRDCQAVVAVPVGGDFDLGGGYDDYGATSGGDAFDDAFSPGPAQARPQRRPAARRKPAKKSGSNAGIIVAAVGGGITVVALIVVGIIFAVKPGDKSGKSSDSPQIIRVPDSNINPMQGMPERNGGGVDAQRANIYQQHERIANDVAAQVRELESAMQSVRDRNSARVAAGRMNRVCDRVEQLANEEKRLPRLTVSEAQRLQAKMQAELAGITQRMQAVGFRAGQASQGEPSFVAAANRLKTVGNRLQQMGGR